MLASLAACSVPQPWERVRLDGIPDDKIPEVDRVPEIEAQPLPTAR